MNKCIDCKKELSEKRAKRCRHCARKHQYTTRPETHPMKGKNHSEFTKSKMSLSKLNENNTQYIDGRCAKKYYCKNCKQEVSDYRIERCQSCESKRRIELGIVNISGNKNPNWNNGSSFEPYSPEWTEELRESIRKRDNYECQNCGMTEEEHLIAIGKILCIHHIDYNKQNCDKNNLITACQGCNTRFNYNRDLWIKILKDKVISMEKLNNVRLTK